MSKIFLLFAIVVSLKAGEYYAKIEPIEKYQLKSQVLGEVVLSDTSMEGRFIDSATLIQIDDSLDKKNLYTSEEKLRLLNDNLDLSYDILENTKEIANIKKGQYDKFNELATRSQINKDNDFFNYLSAYNTYLNTKEKVISLKTQINDMKYSIATLKDRIKNKKISVKNLFVYKIYVKKYDYVNIATPLVDLYDISSGKLEIYLPVEEVENINNKSIYIDGKKTKYKIDKLYKVADSERISSYKAEIIIDKPTVFSKLVKVEVSK
jgi:hypothetical protein